MTKLGKFLATTLTMATLAVNLLPCGNVTAAQGATIAKRSVTRTISGDNIPTNVIDSEEEEEIVRTIKKDGQTTESSKMRKVAKAADWTDEKGRIFLPYTGQYLKKSAFNKLLKEVKNPKADLILTNAAIFNKVDLQLAAVYTENELNIYVTNTGLEKLEGVRLYIRRVGNKMQIFADSADDRIAYCEVKIGNNTKVIKADMETSAGGEENLSKTLLLSANGEDIGNGKNGNMKKGETIKVTLTLK